MTIIPVTNTVQLKCEQSNVDIPSIAESHSMVAVLQKVSLISGYTFFQCDGSPQFINYVNYQHWYADKENLIKGMTECITTHYSEGSLHTIPLGQGSTQLAAIVLGAGLTCKVSGIPLTMVAYRFCLTRCTPVCNVPDNSHDQLAEWCSTLELAQESAVATIARL
jgi:hypothetical protein